MNILTFFIFLVFCNCAFGADTLPAESKLFRRSFLSLTCASILEDTNEIPAMDVASKLSPGAQRFLSRFRIVPESFSERLRGLSRSERATVHIPELVESLNAVKDLLKPYHPHSEILKTLAQQMIQQQQVSYEGFWYYSLLTLVMRVKGQLFQANEIFLPRPEEYQSQLLSLFKKIGPEMPGKFWHVVVMNALLPFQENITLVPLIDSSSGPERALGNSILPKFAKAKEKTLRFF